MAEDKAHEFHSFIIKITKKYLKTKKYEPRQSEKKTMYSNK